MTDAQTAFTNAIGSRFTTLIHRRIGKGDTLRTLKLIQQVQIDTSTTTATVTYGIYNNGLYSWMPENTDVLQAVDRFNQFMADVRSGVYVQRILQEAMGHDFLGQRLIQEARDALR